MVYKLYKIIIRNKIKIIYKIIAIKSSGVICETMTIIAILLCIIIILLEIISRYKCAGIRIIK